MQFIFDGTANYFLLLVLRIIFSLALRIIFHGIVNLFFGLQYIAGLRLRGTGGCLTFSLGGYFENCTSAFYKENARAKLNVRERTERGLQVFLQNLKGVVSLCQIDEVFWTGCKTRTFSLRHLCGFIFMEMDKSVQRQIT